MKAIRSGISGLMLFILLASCQTVKPYQKVYLNDHEMQDGKSPGAGFESYAESIREGSSNQGTGKGSGGCGCN